jgi:integrase
MHSSGRHRQKSCGRSAAAGSRQPQASPERRRNPSSGARNARSCGRRRAPDRARCYPAHAPDRFRRMEVLGLKRSWFSRTGHCIRFPDTKSGAQVRALGAAAMDSIDAQPTRAGSPFVFPADWGDGHFIGVVRVLDRICRNAKLEAVTPHVLRLPSRALRAILASPNSR